MDAAPTYASRFASAAATVALAFCVAAVVATLVFAWSDKDPVPLGLLIAAGMLPLLLFAGVRTLVWDWRYAFAAGILIVVLQSATLRTREIDDKSIDFQILIKLGCLGLMGALTLSALFVRRLPLVTAEVVPWTVFLGFTVLNSVHAVQPAMSMVETLSNLVAFLFLYAFVRIAGPQRLVDALIVACFLLCCLSIAAYVLDPQLGRMSDWTNGAFEPTGRLQGVFGTANSAGASAGIGILLMVLASKISFRRPMFFVLVAPMAFCLLASNNRMSLIAVAIGLFYVYLSRGNVGLKLTVAAIIGGFFLLVMTGFSDQILSSVARSGSADEITSGTGRSRIWAVVLDLWTEQPLFGYGGGSAKFILPVHPLLFKAAAHAHDLYLNVLFADGAVGFLMFGTALVSTLRRSAGDRAHILLAMLIFYLVYGITEPMIGGLVAFIPLTFYAVLVLVAVAPDQFRHRSTIRAYTPFKL
ncbi:O-antigen ligase family protein [Methylobacterium sp. J-059]|uniref:O-antigen ligase family protein n=1 Tax=Methylobacterium sp. J-059 TaxID=2836643 RepID=UPI001FBA6E51|nr:O-antigen ligase family protein [Methylobacterium sp. J-059]MCJ2038564.1 O-antigen ligase family protein [Methylobacterium sp. J-059]